ncbi:uncharacterized protein EI90DRAFT_3117218 [Cantharellus anzutake]|uniref:uncharacterized protein n=1 Tax=Cantharellus anzutake TaxID=1750568 RepID=UPI0019066A08|nr:uncharacterized protein EI90DRAFT_3117218 [Cantharellus anzutake]KAF8340709.1 hypothetical protein EI90DRAFT_3117218 [Cantharellus anzutake]
MDGHKNPDPGGTTGPNRTNTRQTRVMYNTSSTTPKQPHQALPRGSKKFTLRGQTGQNTLEDPSPWRNAAANWNQTAQLDNADQDTTLQLPPIQETLITTSIPTLSPNSPELVQNQDLEDGTYDEPDLHDQENQSQSPSDMEDDEMLFLEPSPEDRLEDENHHTMDEANEYMHVAAERILHIQKAGLWQRFLPAYTHWYLGLPKATSPNPGFTKLAGGDLEECLAEAEANVSCLTRTCEYLTNKLELLVSDQNANSVPSPPRRDPDAVAAPMGKPKKTWESVVARNPPKPPLPHSKPKQPNTVVGPQGLTAKQLVEPTVDSRCLIIQVNPPIHPDQRPNGIETWKRANKLLERKNLPHCLRIMAIGYSVAGNIKLMTAPTCKASDLIQYGHEIAVLITENEVLAVLPDMEHYRVKINKVPTHSRSGPMPISMVHEELSTYVAMYRDLSTWRAPKWLGSDETICTKNFASIVLDLTNKDDRDKLLELKTVYLFNYRCMLDTGPGSAPKVTDAGCYWP